MDEGLDTGDILLKKTLPIRRRDTGGSIHDALAAAAPVALAEALTLLKQGRALRQKQDAALATYAPKLTRENGAIDWTATQEQIDRRIRAMNPWPGAFTFLSTAEGSRKLKVFACIQHSRKIGEPGTVVRADKHGLLVAAGQGGVLLREVQIEGKKRMNAKDFLMGTLVAPGVVLGSE
ncbi:MAG: methionyl-tRNA formyltransferase, partial [Chthoniobacteraceae bacterium]